MQVEPSTSVAADLSANVDVNKPTTERRAAKQAAERLLELRNVGVQAETTLVELKNLETAATATTTTAAAPSSKGGGGVYDEFGFSQDEMNRFKAKMEQDRSMQCPHEVSMYEGFHREKKIFVLEVHGCGEIIILRTSHHMLLT